jgi:hypothetical protein
MKIRFRNFLVTFMAPVLATILLLAGTGCGSDTAVTNLTIYGDTTGANKGDFVLVDPDTFPLISAAIMLKVLPADGFDYPVAPPDAKDYYKFRGFLPKNLEHLGEDWNGTGGGNTDMGDYVYAAADGVVFAANDHGGGWGIVIRMIHNYGTTEQPKYIESLYAHVASTWVRPGNRMKRGDVIGTIGNAGGKYHAHLHFEMRKEPGKYIRCGYDGDTLGFVDPTQFILDHRAEK